MAHEVETAYYADRPAWHGVGTVVHGARRWRDAMEIADALWTVEKQPAYARVPVLNEDGVGERYVAMPGRYAVVRTLPDGTPRILGDVGETWTPFQNEAAGVFLDSLIDSGDLRYESVVVLHGGRRIVLLARRPQDVTFGDGERIRPYIALVNSHDGTLALSVRNVMTRIVCANTLAVALGEQTPHQWSVRHTGSLSARITEARRTLELHDRHADAWTQQMRRLLDQPFSHEQFQTMTNELFPLDQREDRTRRDPNLKRRAELLANWSTTRTVPTGLRATRWGAFNIATEYLEHTQRLRGGSGPGAAERRFASAMFGQIHRQRQRVYQLLTR